MRSLPSHCNLLPVPNIREPSQNPEGNGPIEAVYSGQLPRAQSKVERRKELEGQMTDDSIHPSSKQHTVSYS